MPTIRVMAELHTLGSAPPPIVRCDWKVTLVFNGVNCRYSRNRRINHPQINATTVGNTFTIPFTHVRGGNLTLEVAIRSGDWLNVVTAQSRGLKIVGTNPTTSALL